MQRYTVLTIFKCKFNAAWMFVRTYTPTSTYYTISVYVCNIVLRVCCSRSMDGKKTRSNALQLHTHTNAHKHTHTNATTATSATLCGEKVVCACMLPASFRAHLRRSLNRLCCWCVYACHVHCAAYISLGISCLQRGSANAVRITFASIRKYIYSRVVLCVNKERVLFNMICT